MLKPYEYQRTDSIFSSSDEELVNLDVDTLSEADRARIELLAKKLKKEEPSSIFSASNEELMSVKLDTLSIPDLEKLSILDIAIRTSASLNKDICFDKPFNQFLMAMRRLPSQMYGIRIERYLRKNLGLLKATKGDACNKYGANIEIKASYTSTNGTFNFLQIRQYQDLVGYCLLATDIVDYIPNLFFLTPDQMKSEVSKLGSACHISKDEILGNVAIEDRLTVDGPALKRWKQSYKVEDLECMKNILQTIGA